MTNGPGIALNAQQAFPSDGALAAATESLHQKTAELESLLKNAPIGFAFFDREHRYLQINEELAKINGLPVEAHLGRPIAEILPVNALTVDPVLERIFSTGEAVQMEIAGETPKEPGVTRHWFTGFYPVLSDAEGTCMAGAFVVEISRQKRLEEQLRERENQLRVFVDSAPAAIAMLDRDMRYVAVSRRFLHDFQVQDQEVIGRSHYSIFPDLPERWKTIHQQCLAGAVARADEDSFMLNGKEEWLRWEIQPWFDGHGKIGGLVLAGEVITNSKRAQRAVADSEERFRFVAEQAQIGLWDWDIPSNRLECSPVCKQLFGVQTDETMSAERFVAALHPDDRERTRAAVRACWESRGGEAYDTEYRTHWPNGTMRWIQAKGDATFDTHGNPLRMAGIVLDITRRKEAEEALRESEERLRLATEHAEIGFWDVDHINDVLIWPPRVKAMFGISPDVPVSMRDFYNGLHPEDRAATSDAYAAACDPSRHGLYDVEYRTIGKEDGRIRWVAAKGRGVFSAEGRCLRVIGTAIDISNRKETEAKLAESEARLRAMAETVPDLLYVTNGAGFNEYVSPSYTTYTGLTQERLAGLGWLETVHPEDRARIQESWTEAMASGQWYGGEWRLRRHDGAYRWFVSRANPMRDETGRAIKWFGAATDIEAQKQIEKELRIANENLSQFAYAAAHDLREPLRNVAVFTQMLVRSCGDDSNDGIARMKTVITEGVARIENLLEDLLDFTQISAMGEIAADRIDVCSAVEKALQNLSIAISSSEAKVTYGELPVIAGNESHFVQLFQNLVGNAIQYRGSDAPTIAISASMRNDEWLFSVKDNGMGIAPEYHHKIFGLFKRLHGKNIPGTGIGLAICQKIVERYGGRIWIDSDLGRGAEFLFTIPLHLGVSPSPTSLNAS